MRAFFSFQNIEFCDTNIILKNNLHGGNRVNQSKPY